MRKSAWRAPALATILYVVVCLIFVGDTFVVAAIKHEAQANAQVFGQAPVDAAAARASRWYEDWFVKSGLVAASEAQPGMPKDSPFTRTLSAFTQWLDMRMRVFWTIVYAALLRVSYFLIWGPLVLLFTLAAVVDGVVRRRIKQTNMQLSSAERFGYAVLGIQLMGMGAIAALVTPLPLPPLLPLGCLLALSLLVMAALANAQKRI